jgi:hypothetical protein
MLSPMEENQTIIFGIIAIITPLLVGRMVWKRFDRYFGRNDEAYMNTLDYFLKKLGLTSLLAFIVLWAGMAIVFNNSQQ